MRVFSLVHSPTIGELTLAIGDPWGYSDRQLSVTVPIVGIGQGTDGDRTYAAGYRALAAKVRALADSLDERARECESAAHVPDTDRHTPG